MKTTQHNNDDATQHDTTHDIDNARRMYARATSNERFTIAQLSRELHINEKIARRRFRDALRRNDERAIRARDNAMTQRDENNIVRDARLTHEFNVALRDDVIAIITRA